MSSSVAGPDPAPERVLECWPRFCSPMGRPNATIIRRTTSSGRRRLFRQRIRTKLQLHELWPRAFTALEVPRRAARRRRPQSPALPPRLWIVDAAVDLFDEKSHRIRDAERDPPAIL